MFSMIRSAIVAAMVLASPVFADECVDAKNAQRIHNQNSDRAVKKAQAKIDAMKCCSPTYFQAQCDYQKMFVEQVQLDLPHMENVSRACDMRELSDVARKQREEFLAQMKDKQASDCQAAERALKR
ncbi:MULTISPECIES: hypothetical protein [Bradyrhizobium]|uniref:Secreted protein n=1 Tax=Bradyrhizobium vignae TaxID=1549949 RepID=A0A2U3PVB7_9BRAD|nr:hypothetical protein [Bradyrhizobium vignae]SPP93093.1 exported protein of unknown function [Bradyrhizobium vignae]